ncbi:MAG TPA: peptidase M4 [Thermoanaerobaculia bacterium]|jgi:hypothetical protein|nr:peptidase M4 [Thermoanaerobaculia bacterium]
MQIRRRTASKKAASAPQAVIAPPPPPALPQPQCAGPTDFERPIVRPLEAYAFDPSAGKLLGNEMTMNVRYQDLDPGPVVRDLLPDAIAIVDYDGANQTYYKPIDLDHPYVLIRGGLDPAEADPRFHQQMVYAVVSDTIQKFEAALGRRIHWRRAERQGNPNAYLDDIYTLNIYPHAFIGQNAFYSPRAHGILFGYFRAGTGDVGRNIPGQPVFTCLSHDVVVHETTHAIVDGIRAFFMEQTNPEVLAFHEAFADLAALFRHFTHKEVLRDTIERTGGALYKYQLKADAMTSSQDDYKPGTDPLISAQIGRRNPLVELAQQFGEATGKQRALRSALGTKPNSDDIRKISEPHARGSILVAAVFDAYFSIYLKRTADLWRIFRAGGGSDNPTDIPSSLADRLTAEAMRLAEQFFHICVRALDYCPPVDITFGGYLRAIITADFDLHPVDESGMREALMQSFRLRGILPEGAGYFSENAVVWPRTTNMGLPPIQGLDFGDSNGLTRPQKDLDRKVLQAYVDDPVNRGKLGFDLDLPVSIPSFHPVFRILTDGSLRTDLIVEMVQMREVPFNENAPKLGTFPLRGGATLIIQKPRADEPAALKGEATICYVIGKHLHGPEGKKREKRQRRVGERLGLTEGNDPHRFMVNFAMVHGEE